MDIFSSVITILGVKNQDELIEQIITLVSGRVLSYLGISEIPQSLYWVIIEMAVQRFNRIGSEGVSSESVDGGANTYITDDLSPFYKYLDEYIANNDMNKGYKLF